ncbi:hypothetical protein [Fodinicola feengrottensis]|uniref:Secreted protein n=1 Tax=Fodinicola feengrottensis TaxID=435914 RepID=A0ABN2G7B7_9ACTN|nr:hypothetical protein [Fodinicola feengrottensis]
MNLKSKLIVTAGCAFAVAGVLAAAPVAAQAASSLPSVVAAPASNGWHAEGPPTDALTCEENANWYEDNGARATRCDSVGNGLYQLWALIDN